MGAATGGEMVPQSVLRAVAMTPAGARCVQQEGRPAAGPAGSVAGGDGKAFGLDPALVPGQEDQQEEPHGECHPQREGPGHAAAGGFALCRIAPPPPDHEDAGGNKGDQDDQQEWGKGLIHEGIIEIVMVAHTAVNPGAPAGRADPHSRPCA